MVKQTEESMRELGRATGAVSTRQEAKKMIEGLIETIRELRSKVVTADDERVVFNLKAAIEGIRETMPRE